MEPFQEGDSAMKQIRLRLLLVLALTFGVVVSLNRPASGQGDIDFEGPGCRGCKCVQLQTGNTTHYGCADYGQGGMVCCYPGLSGCFSAECGSPGGQ